MGEDLPILKGILNGVVKYHNARMYLFLNIVLIIVLTYLFGYI